MQQAARNVLSVVVVVAFVGPTVAPAAGRSRFSVWAGLTLLGFGARTYVLRRVSKIEALATNVDGWAKFFFSSSLACGLIGASAPLLFFSSLDDLQQMYLTMIFCCW